MDDQEALRGVIEAPVRTDAIRNVYNLLSKVYWPVAFLERRARMKGLELAQVLPDDAILEVAPGLGLTFVEILKRVKSANIVYGIDLSPEMLRKTRKRVRQIRLMPSRRIQVDEAHGKPGRTQQVDGLAFNTSAEGALGNRRKGKKAVMPRCLAGGVRGPSPH